MWESENQDESPLMTTDNFHGIDRLGHRRKLSRAIAGLDGALAPASAPRPTPLPIPPEAILAAAAAGASPERQRGEDHSVSPLPQPSPMSSRVRPAEMIGGDRFLPSPEGPTLLLTASDDRHDDDIQTAETGEAYGANDCYDDLPSPRWRDRLVIVIAVIALAGLGAVGAFAYRAVFAGIVMPALPPTIKAENASNTGRIEVSVPCAGYFAALCRRQAPQN